MHGARRSVSGSLAALGAAAVLVCPGRPASAADWAWLDNGRLRLGVDKAAGASVGFFGESGGGRDFLNHYDLGRYLQQSFYGAPDGSDWAGKPWNWNPVQGGDWRGHPATVIEFGQTPTEIHAKTRPRHWATGADLPGVVMEELITLEGATAHIRFSAFFSVATNQPPHHQEMPALYLDGALRRVAFYGGAAPWTDGPLTVRIPGPVNEYERLPEQWAAFVDDEGRGVGLYAPGTEAMTCFHVPGPTGPAGSGCSYFAPIRTLAITNGMVVRYDVGLTLGTLSQIRAELNRLHVEGWRRVGGKKP